MYVYWGLGKLQHGTAEEVIVMGQSARYAKVMLSVKKRVEGTTVIMIKIYNYL